MKRVLALALCVIMCLTLLSGCGATGLKINGRNIDLGYYSYYYGVAYRDNLIYGMEQVQSAALQSLFGHFAVEEIAKEYNIALEPLERKAIIDSVNEQIEENGDAAWNSMLNALYMNRNQYLDVWYNYYLSEKVQATLFDRETGPLALTDEEVIESYKRDYVRARHILISTQEATSDAEFGQALKEAEEVLARLNAGEDFATLLNEYNDDPGATEEGYYFTTGQMVESFEEASFALEIGGRSEIVQSSYGYHIIERLPIEDEYVNSIVDDLYDYYSYIAYAQLIYDTVDAMEVETTEAFFNHNVQGAISVFS